MSQAEVLEFLKKNPNKRFTSNEIGKGTEINLGALSTNLRKLRERNEVRHKDDICARGTFRFLYSHKK